MTEAPSDAIGLSDRLLAEIGQPVIYRNDAVLREAATALDALQARVEELEKAIAHEWFIEQCGEIGYVGIRDYSAMESRATSAEQERDKLQGMLLLCGELGGIGKDETPVAYLRRLIDGLVDAGRERDALRKTLRIERDCSLNETRLKDQYKRERDEAYERACGVIRQWTNHAHMQLCAGEMTAQERRTTEAILNAVERQVRRLAAGTEKEGNNA